MATTVGKLTTAGSVSSGFQPVDGDLTALAALTGTNTIYYRSGANTWSPVTFSGLTFSGGVLTAGGGVSDGDKGDITVSASGATWTLDTVNSNVGSFGSGSAIPTFTVNAKGLITAAGTTTNAPIWSNISSKPTTLAGYGITDAGEAQAYGILTSDYTLTSVTTAQKAFNWSTNGALTLATGYYSFEAMLYMTTMSATSGNAAFDLKGAGTATLANIGYQTNGADSATPTNTGAASGRVSVTSGSGGDMVTAGTTAGMRAQIFGMFQVSASGTIIPSVALTTAAAAVVKAGSYFRAVRIGSSATGGTWS